jgi:hypothetical protein
MNLRRCVFAWLLLAAVLCRATSLFAGTGTGERLRDECQWVQKSESELDEEQHLKYALCVSYVVGVADGFYLGGGKLCLPNKSVTNSQTALVVFRHLDSHPEELHDDSGVLVVKALRKACCK